MSLPQLLLQGAVMLSCCYDGGRITSYLGKVGESIRWADDPSKWRELPRCVIGVILTRPDRTRRR